MNFSYHNGRHTLMGGVNSLSGIYFMHGAAAPAGNLRINTTTRELEVYTGTQWQRVPNQSLHVDLTPDANEALDWAIQQVRQEREAQRLAETNSSVKLALDAVSTARQQLSVILTLAKSEQENNHV